MPEQTKGQKLVEEWLAEVDKRGPMSPGDEGYDPKYDEIADLAERVDKLLTECGVS